MIPLEVCQHVYTSLVKLDNQLLIARKTLDDPALVHQAMDLMERLAVENGKSNPTIEAKARRTAEVLDNFREILGDFQEIIDVAEIITEGASDGQEEAG